MSEQEVWSFLEGGHTAVLTTLRRDGWPVSLPLWYVVDGRVVYVATPTRSMKVARIRNDDRACLLVEQGERWEELAAVELPVRAVVMDTGPEADRILALFDSKYAGHRPARARMPDAASRHYSDQAVIRLDPAGAPVSWDNSRIRLRG